MNSSEIGKKRARYNFLKKKDKPDNYLKGIIKRCNEEIDFANKQSFSEDVKWHMRAFETDEKTAIQEQKHFKTERKFFRKEMIILATAELKKRGNK